MRRQLLAVAVVQLRRCSSRSSSSSSRSGNGSGTGTKKGAGVVVVVVVVVVAVAVAVVVVVVVVVAVEIETLIGMRRGAAATGVFPKVHPAQQMRRFSSAVPQTPSPA